MEIRSKERLEMEDKKKQEIFEILENVGFTENAIIKIAGFLIGAGIKKPNEKVLIKVGNKDFDVFYALYCQLDNKYNNTSKTIKSCTIHYFYV